MTRAYRWPLVAACLVTSAAGADPWPLAAFASSPRVEGVAVSTDGRYLATLETLQGKGGVFVRERAADPATPARPVLGAPPGFRIHWCRFATGTRLLCGLRVMVHDVGFVYSATRLVAVDADGKNMKVLVENKVAAQGQYQDRILHWNPGPPDTVLIEADEGADGTTRRMLAAGGDVVGEVGTHSLPAVWELNVLTGQLKMRQHARDPVRHWMADPHGQVRLGWGEDKATLSLYARRDGELEWRRLSKFEAFSGAAHFDPVAISAEEPNRAYARASAEGHDALWLIDLSDQSAPEIVFMHPAVDIARPLIDGSGRLFGVRYETDLPNAFYTDGRAANLMGAVKKRYPQLFSEIVDSSRDGKVVVVRSYSDVEPPRYSVIDTTSGHVTEFGASGDGPPLPAAEALAPMQPVNYPARDGTVIPGYLTVSRGVAARQLPLIVMPHGGPIYRDAWAYDFLVQFLASRGYVVLQMNFRGSDGYGGEWFYAAHQDWGGLSYDDVVDGARWAIARGIADPHRVCIVGWSFGGYLALVGAQRDAAVFRCAASIAGLSDLGLLLEEEDHFLNPELAQKQVGTDREKLRRNSPRQHAAEFGAPVLLIHGDLDAQAQFEQSKVMDAALTRAGKPHRFVPIKDADHQMSRASDRVTLLTELEAFLGEHLGPAAAAAASGGR